MNLFVYHQNKLLFDYSKRNVIHHTEEKLTSSGNKERMNLQRQAERKVKRGYSKKYSLKENRFMETLELFLLFQGPHPTAAFETHSLCSSPAWRSSGEKRGGMRRRHSVKSH